jgi:hypothetical protein
VRRFFNLKTMKDKLQNELRELLSRLPDAPVSSNFTNRVLQAIELEDSRTQKSVPRWNWHSLLPRVAFPAVAIMFAGLSLHHYEVANQRTDLAQSVARVAGPQSPDVEALKNFDVIQRMSQPQRADDQLLALMQ